jgi:hypothetical protein
MAAFPAWAITITLRSWSSLKYDTGLGGCVVNLTKEQLDKAPRYANDNDKLEPRERPVSP